MVIPNGLMDKSPSVRDAVSRSFNKELSNDNATATVIPPGMSHQGKSELVLVQAAISVGRVERIIGVEVEPVTGVEVFEISVEATMEAERVWVAIGICLAVGICVAVESGTNGITGGLMTCPPPDECGTDVSAGITTGVKVSVGVSVGVEEGVSVGVGVSVSVGVGVEVSVGEGVNVSVGGEA